MSGRTPLTVLQEADRHWIRLTLLAWLLVAVSVVWNRYGSIYWLALGDTDDNMRLMQVRALLDGQGWFDLRNHRLNPPVGANIHWSRLVDLPIAALILILRPFVGADWAERWACGIAPLLPLSVTMLGMAATVRRLVAPLAWPLALVFLMCCSVMLFMFMPERIDHHGWQLAMLSLTVAGLCDPERRRGGALVGIASAVSLTIGLEMLPYAAMAGAILALRWVWDRTEATRLEFYALTLSAGSAIGYAGFQGWDSSVPRCDALTPVWLTVMVAAGGLLFVLARVSPASRNLRLALAVAAGAIIAVGFARLFPQCLGRPEQVSPELARNWLDNVREAKPIYKHALRDDFPIAALPVVGILGAIAATMRARGERLWNGWLPVLLFSTFACLMLLWQIRAGPAAQLLAVPGVTALTWWLVPWCRGHRNPLVRVLGTVAVVLVAGIGLFAGTVLRLLPIEQPKAYVRRVNHATGMCLTRPALAALDRYPAQTIFTFVDLSPRLITTTHHDAIAGPYHRNGAAILDVQHAFTGSPAQARAIMRAHGATLLVVCPNMSESTVYRARAPRGFYGQLAHGRKFPWLTQLPLLRGDPLVVWRID
ncbi:MAG: hypothetical protein ACRYFW_17460 [Janthinobacterium lividum]